MQQFKSLSVAYKRLINKFNKVMEPTKDHHEKQIALRAHINALEDGLNIEHNQNKSFNAESLLYHVKMVRELVEEGADNQSYTVDNSGETIVITNNGTTTGNQNQGVQGHTSIH